MLLLVIGCTEEESGTTLVVTEEVLYTSGEQVRLLGRLITNQPVTANDHGFYLSHDANFSAPIIISLGIKEGAGRFIGEAEALSARKKYFAKAFMDLGNGIEFGNVIELETLAAGIDSYSPGFGTTNQEVFILGKNFTKDTKVFFGTEEAQVLENLFESRLRVKIPPINGQASVKIRVESQDQVLTFPTSFEYQTGSYQKMAVYPEDVRMVDNIYFQSGGRLYMGLGSDRLLTFYPKIFSYDPVTNQWSNSNFPGSPRSFGFATSNYLGGGIAELGREPFSINSSFWRVTGGNYVRLKDLPFRSRESVAFEISNELYVLGGKEGDPLALRKHQALSDSWVSLNSSPRVFEDTDPHFVYQGKLFILGSDKALYSYDPVTTDWSSISNFPGSLGQGYGFAYVIGSKAYFGGFKRSNEMWELNLTTLTWLPKNPIPGTSQTITSGSFVQGQYIYFTRQQDITLVGSFPLDLYRFDPNGI